jgi:hypothetical protein
MPNFLGDLAYVSRETPHIPQETPHDPQAGGQVSQDLD